MKLPPDVADRYFQTFAKEIVSCANSLACAGRHSEVFSDLSILIHGCIQRTLDVQGRSTVHLGTLTQLVRCYSSLDEAEKCLEYTRKSVEVRAAEKLDEIYCDLRLAAAFIRPTLGHL